MAYPTGLSDMRATVAGVDAGETLTVVIFGATGDLAKRKLFPALYQLMYACPDAPLLPVMTRTGQVLVPGRRQRRRRQARRRGVDSDAPEVHRRRRVVRS